MKTLSSPTILIIALLTFSLPSIAMKRLNSDNTNTSDNFLETDENYRNLAQIADIHIKNLVDVIDTNINTCPYASQLPPHIHPLPSNDKNDRISYVIINNNFSANNTQHEEIVSLLCKKNVYARAAFNYFIHQIKNNIKSVTAENLKTIEAYNSTTLFTRFNLLPLFIRQIIHTQAFKNINHRTHLEHKDSEGIVRTTLSFQKPIVAISSNNAGFIIFDAQTEQRVATYKKETPSLLCFNNSGLCIATMTYDYEHNQSIIKQYNTRTGCMQNSLTLGAYCHHISYEKETRKRIISVVTSTDASTPPNKKVSIECNKDTERIVSIRTLSMFESEAYNRIHPQSYKNRMSQYCTISHQPNKEGIITQVTVSKRTPLNFYLCHHAINNTNKKEDLLKIKKSQSYISLDPHKKNTINSIFDHKNKLLNFAHLNQTNQSLQHIKY